MLGIVLIFPVISWVIFSVIPKKKFYQTVNNEVNDFGVIVTAYKHIDNLHNVIDSLLAMNYNNYIVYVVCDNCPPFTYREDDERVVILHPPVPFTNQVKSHFFAIENFKRAHNRIIIIDSDNLVDSEILNAIAPWFNRGYEAVQGVRTAKNINTSLARLDAVGELYYLYYDRIILFGIGSSSMLSGSGMAFTTELYRKCMGEHKLSGAGFDKVLQYRLLSAGKRIAFEPKAIVYDEKTAHSDQLVKQRARWNNTWFRFFPFSLRLMCSGLFKLSINRFLYGFILFRPPLFILLGLTSITILINFFVHPAYNIFWLFACMLFALGFLLALKQMKAPGKLYRSLLLAPKFIFLQILSLRRARKANQYSVATEHRYHEPKN